MAFEIGERITSSFTGPGTIIGPLERDEDNVAIQRVQFDDPVFGIRLREVGKMQPYEAPKAKAFVPRIPRSLKVAVYEPTLEGFIAYLRTPQARTLLTLQAQCPDMDFAVRQQYHKLSGENLVEGQGYTVGLESSKKRGCEGDVSFVMPAEVPEEVTARMKQRPGFINHIDFVWMLIGQGFRVTRGKIQKEGGDGSKA